MVAVEEGDTEAFSGGIAREVRAHHCQTQYAKFR
jgi:hypothetical protein